MLFEELNLCTRNNYYDFFHTFVRFRNVRSLIGLSIDFLLFFILIKGMRMGKLSLSQSDKVFVINLIAIIFRYGS